MQPGSGGSSIKPTCAPPVCSTASRGDLQGNGEEWAKRHSKPCSEGLWPVLGCQADLPNHEKPVFGTTNSTVAEETLPGGGPAVIQVGFSEPMRKAWKILQALRDLRETHGLIQ